jgi:hypothetical protein
MRPEPLVRILIVPALSLANGMPSSSENAFNEIQGENFDAYLEKKMF